jgi:uncharacterized membrane protein
MLHLFHPAVVHVSVAFLVVGGVVEIWGLLRHHPGASRFGVVLVVIGTLSLVPSLVTGYLAANTITLPEGTRSLLDAHERNGWILFGLFGGMLFWRAFAGGEPSSAQRPFYVAVLVVAVLFTAYNALLGGEMVYLHGVGVLSPD